MNEYIKNLQVNIDSKLQEFAMTEGFSIIDLHILYHHQIEQVSNIYRIPSEHYSKVMAIAYNQTIEKIYKVKR
jgi:hypothetical protein